MWPWEYLVSLLDNLKFFRPGLKGEVAAKAAFLTSVPWEEGLCLIFG